MSALPGNPHYDGARYHADGDEFDQCRAQAEAMLALAYEQRTANLIAYIDQLWRAGEDVPGALDAQIRERLGMAVA